MRKIWKKIACAAASAAMVLTMVPVTKSTAAETFALNRTSQILYTNKGASYNKQTYDFNFAKAPKNYLKDYSFAWATDKAEVATVKSGGVVTAVGVGKCKITCAVTEKATGNVAAMVTAEVEVKANAKTVYVSNASKYEGHAFEAGDVVDLNRSMTDYSGHTTNKRGTYVTDLTRWVAEPSVGVTINQSNGQYTFDENATGEYELYCETYQSKKHPEAVATSEPVHVTVNNAQKLSVKQTTATSLSVTFDNGMKTLKTEDVSLCYIAKNGSDEFRYPQIISEAVLGKDGRSAVINTFSNLSDGVTYELKVAGFTPVTFKASFGEPVSMTISAKPGSIDPIALAGEETPIYVHLYDKNGVDVTQGNETIVFSTKKIPADGSYYATENGIFFTKGGLTATLVAEYQSGKYDNGKPVGNITVGLDFTSVNTALTAVTGITDATLTGWESKSLEVPFGESAVLQVKMKDTDGNEIVVYKNGQTLPNGLGTVVFEDVSPNVAALNMDGESLVVVQYRQGAASFIVNLVKDGKKTPVGSVTVSIRAPRTVASLAIDKTNVTVGIVDGFDEESIRLEARDQYDKEIVIEKAEFSGVNEMAQKVVSALSFSEGRIRIDGSKMESAFGNATAVQLLYKVKVNDAKEISFYVLLKKQIPGATNSVSWEVSEGSLTGDVARTATSKNAKYAIVKAFTKNNEVKIGVTKVVPAPSNTSDIIADNYYYKVFKNDKEIKVDGINVVDLNGDGVRLNFSGEKAGKVTGKAVSYDAMGAGSYSVILYRGVVSGNSRLLVQTAKVSGITTCTIGEYTLLGRTAEFYVDNLLKCFAFKNTQGENVPADFKNVVFTKDTSATSYVNVKNAVFADEIENGLYAEYTVNIGISLERK